MRSLGVTALALVLVGCGTVRGQGPSEEPGRRDPAGPPAPATRPGEGEVPTAPGTPPKRPVPRDQPVTLPVPAGDPAGPPLPTGPSPTVPSVPGPPPVLTGPPAGQPAPREPGAVRYEPILRPAAPATAPVQPVADPPRGVPGGTERPAGTPVEPTQPVEPPPFQGPPETADGPPVPAVAAPTSVGSAVVAGHLLAYRIREALAFAAALEPDADPLDTVWPEAASLADNPRWLAAFPVDDPAASGLARRLAERLAATLGPCEDAGCWTHSAQARRFAGALPDGPRSALLAELARRDERLATWRDPKPGTFGVLLPLSGPWEAFGKTAREALDLYAGAFPGVTLVYRDTGADPTRAAAMAEELIFDERVGAILGPIGRQESAPVVALCRRWAVAQLPLGSSLEPSTDALDPVLRLRTSPAELALDLARYARAELGLGRLAVLTSDGTAHREQAEAFAAEWERLGGVVVRTVTFATQDKSFDKPLGELVQSARPKGGKVDFDALYLAAPGAVARKVASHLAYWGVPLKTAPGQRRASKKAPAPVQLLGSADWATAQVLDRTERVTDNAIFPDVWAPDRPDAVVVDFAERFQRTHGKRPTGFHAEAFDVLRVAVEADLEARLPQLGPMTGEPLPARLKVTQALVRDRTTPLVTGPLVVSGGKAQPRTHLMTVQGEGIRSRRTEEEEKLLFAPPDPNATPPETRGGSVVP